MTVTTDREAFRAEALSWMLALPPSEYLPADLPQPERERRINTALDATWTDSLHSPGAWMDRAELWLSRQGLPELPALSERALFDDRTTRFSVASVDGEVLAEVLLPAWLAESDAGRQALERFAEELRAAEDPLRQ
jgi:hypothetical protein